MKTPTHDWKKRLTALLGHRVTLRLALMAVVAAVAVVATLWTCKAAEETHLTIGTDQTIDVTAEQIESIKAIGEWEFLTVADEELVDTVRLGFFTDDHLVRIYYGTVRLGIDLNDVTPGWIAANGDSISVRLPAVKLLSDDFIDEARTKSFHESGRWKAADREALYRKAKRLMKAHCVTKENLSSAQKNGEAQVQRLLRSMGYEHVSIRWE